MHFSDMHRLLLFTLAFIMTLVAQESYAAGPTLFNVTERAATAADPWSRKIGPLWRHVLESEKKRPGFTAKGEHMHPGDALVWRNIVAYAPKVSERELLRIINGSFNQWRPKNDGDTWNTPEYWASPREFFSKRGGDCEDYAIAKYYALRFLGMDVSRMRITVVRRKDEKGNWLPELHAVLAVRSGDLWFILDNNARPKDNIFPHTQYKGRFVPLYSMNENGAWIHGE